MGLSFQIVDCLVLQEQQLVELNLLAQKLIKKKTASHQVHILRTILPSCGRVCLNSSNAGSDKQIPLIGSAAN